MNILWITNILFPEAERMLSGSGELRSSGGWMLGSANALLEKEDTRLAVATVSNGVKELTKLDGEKITYYVIPYGRGNQKINPDYCPYWERINEDYSPDVVHIHGTEFSHGYAYMQACGAENVVVSLQGLTSAISKYYYSGISVLDIVRNATLRDLIRGSIIREKKRFRDRGKYEIEMLRSAKHIIGRTSWDRAHAWAINPSAQYHFCNETLRPEFYNGDSWTYDKCEKHTIFISQASYPIKGLHQVLKAMPLILCHFPDAKIRVAGVDITRHRSIKDRMHYTGYGKYINSLIRKLGLEDKVVFMGSLNAGEMLNEYLRANVFVCPSSIENSPNSLGEAQILGTPCVASYVGGIPDMMKGSEDGLYRFEEIEMLAAKVCDVFSLAEKQVNLKAVAEERHDSSINSATLLSIYQIVKRK